MGLKNITFFSNKSVGVSIVINIDDYELSFQYVFFNACVGAKCCDEVGEREENQQ